MVAVRYMTVRTKVYNTIICMCVIITTHIRIWLDAHIFMIWNMNKSNRLSGKLICTHTILTKMTELIMRWFMVDVAVEGFVCC